MRTEGRPLPPVYVVALNWNNGHDSVRLLDSLYRSEYGRFAVILCDNGSTDDSVAHIESWARQQHLDVEVVDGTSGEGGAHREPERLRDPEGAPPGRLIILLNGRNLGYARGNNAGLELALRGRAQYVLVLNNDVTVEPTTLSHLVDFGERHQDAALMAPTIFEPKGDRFVAADPAAWTHRPKVAEALIPAAFRRGPTGMPSIAPAFEARRLYYAPGCAMMFRTSTLARVGFFDDATFLYYEEMIMAEKLSAAGLATWFVPEAVVYHLHGASTAKLEQSEKYIMSVVSQKRYYQVYRGAGQLFLMALSAKVTVAYVMRALRHSTYRTNMGKFLRTYYGMGRADRGTH